ncbi:MAG: nucleoside phosphorylase [Marinilabiliaceae bacterium]|nr:nucleoside phosphorylase [Marinilabiliaceae bacterium]
MNKHIEESELILNDDGSVFHLHLKPGEISDTIILVGDPARVKMIAGFFDSVELTRQNREFHTITGVYHKKRISVVATGIGTDNIDIVLNELDALVNVDFETRQVKSYHTSLNIVRIGTSGSLQYNIPVDSWLISKIVIGFDGLLNFYEGGAELSDNNFENALMTHVNWNKRLTTPYVINADEELFQRIFVNDMNEGITISAPGFYGPQGRVIRLNIQNRDINSKISSFEYNKLKITNYEMECSAIYGLSALMGHKAVTVCAIIANRLRGEYSKDYHPVVERLVKTVLDKLSIE